MTRRPVLVWCEGGVAERAEVSPRFYLGRHPSPPPGRQAMSVYAMRYGSLEIEAEVPGSYPTVSRLHALVKVEGARIVVRDHGPRGGGSRNGTFLNGAPVPRGGSRESVGWAVVGLALSGPRVLVLAPGAGEVRLPGGAAAEALQVPECIASAAAVPGSVAGVTLPGERGWECLVLARLGWMLAELQYRASGVGAGDEEYRALAARALRLASKARGLLSEVLGEREASNLEHALNAAASGLLGAPWGVVERARVLLESAHERLCGGWEE